MAKLINLEPNKTYATRENAIAAVEKKVPAHKLMHCRYIIMQHTDGRYFPVFIGMQAMQEMLHFHFNILA